MPRFPSNPKVWLSNSSWTGSIRVVFLYRRAHPNSPLPLPVRMTAPMANTLLQLGGGGRRGGDDHVSSATNKSSLLQVSKQGEYRKGFGLLYPPDWRIFKVLNCFVTKVIKILESHAKTTFFSYFTKGNNVAHNVHCNSDQGLLFKLTKSDEIISSSLNNPTHMF